jgi:PHD/YefM family antitoxin component YafN of YafNO toxin-antitoxin module
MLQSELTKITRRYNIPKVEYIYSNNEIKSVLINIDDFIKLIETIDINLNAELMNSIKKGFKDFENGNIETEDEVFADL